MSGSTLVWFRRDLRLDDNPALLAAVARGGPVIPVFLWCPQEEGEWPPGGASRWWLHQSLLALGAALAARGARLIVRSHTWGAALPDERPRSALDLLLGLVAETGARGVHWNRLYEPAAIARDVAVKAQLLAAGINAASFSANLLFEPWTITNEAGKPLQVFTPFWRRCLAREEPSEPTPAPPALPAPPAWPAGESPESLQLEPRIDWAAGIRAAWTPGEDGACRQLERFVRDAAAGYAAERDRPDRPGTSRLSPHLHFGEISPRRVWCAVRGARAARDRGARRGQKATPRGADRTGTAAGGAAYLRELGWREFAHHLLYHFPESVHAPLRPEFREFPWRADPAALEAWQRGRTGYPLVDAGMRELWATGWMHNRMRMVVASFLVKHLLLPWQAGAAWFWDTLVDADLANNTLGWQWSAGCGADAAPYFRVFNPVLQGERFDPEGAYVRRWVPELAALPAKRIQRPWDADPVVLAQAGVRLGETYPRPIVDHAQARGRALAAFAQLRK